MLVDCVRGWVNKEKLTNIRISLEPEDSSQEITVVLTGKDIGDLTLRGAGATYGFDLDTNKRLMYSNGVMFISDGKCTSMFLSMYAITILVFSKRKWFVTYFLREQKYLWKRQENKKCL